MDEQKILAERFEANRSHLRAIAYRMLGSRSEAEDAVQDVWLRLSRADISDVDNFRGWLTTVAARVCLDMLRSRKSRREEALDAEGPELPGSGEEDAEPGRDMELADSVGLALLVVLETLAPAERVAFVLHDMFDLPFDDIAPIVGRSPAAARQLASRARRRVRGGTPAGETDRDRRQEVVEAFLAASRGGDFEALLAVLDPEVVLRADHAAVAASLARAAAGAPVLAPEMRGAAVVAEAFRGRAQGAQRALINDVLGLAWAPGGQPRAVFSFTVADGRIVGIDLIADPERIGELAVVLLEA
jgi:RNA polymerase sigma-70 factor (ECF subfamily)